MKHQAQAGDRAVLQHWHVIQMAGEQHELHHAQLVRLDNPAHTHHVTVESSNARFLPENLDGARQAAGFGL